MGEPANGPELPVPLGPLMTGAGGTGRVRASPLGEDNRPVVPAEGSRPWRSQLGLGNMVPEAPEVPGNPRYHDLVVSRVASGGTLSLKRIAAAPLWVGKAPSTPSEEAAKPV